MFVSSTTTISESSSGMACVVFDGPPSSLDVEVTVLISTSLNGKAGNSWKCVSDYKKT